MKREFAAALILISASVGAEEIVVTASRTEPSVVELGGTVISADAIAALQPATTLDLLDRVAGVRAFQKGGEGGGSYLSLRGGEPNFTLVLLDGVKVGDPTNSQGGAFDFGQIDPAALERIEVARGGLSAVHGADALAGVVNLRLRQPVAGEDFGSARLFGDTRGRVGGDATAGLGWRDGGLLLSAGGYDSGDGTVGSDLQRRQLLAKVAQEVGGWTLSGLALHARSERSVFPEDSGGPRLAVLRDRETGSARLTIGSVDLARDAAAKLRPHLALNWTRQVSASDSPGIAPGVLDGVPPITADTRFERTEALGDMRWRVADVLTVVAGGGYLNERGRSSGVVDFGFPIPADFRIRRHVASGFAEATIGARAQLTGGVRYDDPSTAKGEWTGRVSGRLPVGGFTLTGGWSEGYKLPSLYALAYPLIANPALKPERSENWEAGVERKWDGGRVRAGYFHTHFSDLIDFDPALFTNVNRARVTTQGVEAQGEWTLGNWSADGSLTWLDVSSATPLRSRPHWQGAARLAWRAEPRLMLDAALRFNSSFLDSSVPTGLIRADGHTEIDLGARYALSDVLSLSLVARNLLSANYEDSVGFPGEGRTLRASLSARF